MRCARGFRARWWGSVVARWEDRVERVRWAEGDREVRREREPVWVVRRMEEGWGGGGEDGEGVDAEGGEGGEGSRVMVVG